jgi:hypothetical protein
MLRLNNFLSVTRKNTKSYIEGLHLARDYVVSEAGQVIQGDDKETILILGEETATCFQPYETIDLFYFES